MVSYGLIIKLLVQHSVHDRWCLLFVTTKVQISHRNMQWDCLQRKIMKSKWRLIPRVSRGNQPGCKCDDPTVRHLWKPGLVPTTLGLFTIVWRCNQQLPAPTGHWIWGRAPSTVGGTNFYICHHNHSHQYDCLQQRFISIMVAIIHSQPCCRHMYIYIHVYLFVFINSIYHWC